MTGICNNCRRNGKAPLKCTNQYKLTQAKCRRCRENGLECVSGNISIIPILSGRTPECRHVSATARFSPLRTHHTRASQLRAIRNESIAQSIEVDQSDQDRLQTTIIRPSQDSWAGNIRQVLIALDIGSGNVKAAWKPIYNSKQQRALVDRLRHGCRPVFWNNSQAHCPAQIAYKLMYGADGCWHLQQYWGCDVDDELERGDLSERDVLKWVKPVIFNYEDPDSLRFHKGQFEERLKQLQRQAEEFQVPEEEWRHIDELSVYSDLMKFAYEFVCGKIVEEFPRVESLLMTTEQGLTTSIVEVALPVPAGALPKHIKMVLEAAARANLPNPLPVAEPTAAIVYYLQEQMETSTDQVVLEHQNVLLLDAGEGSLDAILCSIVERSTQDIPIDGTVGPLLERRYVLREEVAGLTKWAGGSFANQACQQWLERTFDTEFDEMLLHPLHRQRYKTKSNIIDELVRDFETRKKRFSGSLLAHGDEVRLVLHGFPPRRTNNNNGGYITIDKAAMVGFFATQLETSLNLIKEQMERFRLKGPIARAVYPVEQIIFVGGASESKYIREAIRRHLAQNACAGRNTRLDVKLPQITRLNTLTAQGALLLLQDKDFIGERILRRGYCVKWDRPTFLRKSTRDFLVEKDCEDGVMCKRDVSRFLLRMGDRIGYRHSVSMRYGWRALCMNPLPDDTGFDRCTNRFLIDEHFFFCDKESYDDLYVYYKPNGFQEVGMVTFSLDRDLCHNFVETYEYDGKGYWRVQYEVRIEVVGLDFEYTMIIPENGVFEGEGSDGYGEHPIIKRGRLRWRDRGGLCIV